MKKLILIISSILLTLCVNAQNAEWIEHGKAPKAEQGNAITYDNNGNIYITGTFQDSVRFGNILLTSSFSDYCAKYDTLGNVIWAKKNIGGGGITFDGTSNLYAFGKDTKTLKKLDLNGNIIWSNNLFTSTIGSNGIQGVYANGTDFYVTGYYSGDATFGSNMITNAGNWDIFIAKFNSAGVNTWVKGAGGTDLDKGYGIYVNNANEVYAAGYFKGTANFESTQVVSVGNGDMYLSKYDPNGNLIWVNAYGSAGLDLTAVIVADENENLYTTGRFNGSITFGTTTLNSASSDAFITKFDANGNALWAKGISGQGSDEEGDLYYDNGVLAFISTTSADVTIDALTLTGEGALDICVGNIDTLGNVLWAKIYGGTNLDEGSGVVLVNNSTYFNGSFKNAVNFDSFSLTSLGNWDVVTGKINNPISTAVVQASSSKSDFIVYPNPVNNQLTIELDNYQNSTLKILTIDGKVINNLLLLNQATKLNLDYLKAGIYYVIIKTNDSSSVKKIVKK